MYQPATRLLTILELLQTHPALSGDDLARRLEVEPRSVRRYIMSLQDMGMPVEAVRGPGGGYRLRPGFKLPPLLFTAEEATAVVLGLLGTAWLQLDQSAVAVEGALAKVLRVLPLSARERLSAISAHLILSPHDQETPPDAALLVTLSEAIEQRRRIAIAYRNQHDQLSRRTVEPYALAGWWGSWYLIGYCCLRRDFRMFRLDRLSVEQAAGATFERDAAFDAQAFLEQHMGLGESGYQIEVVFDAPPAVVRAKVNSGFGTLTETGEGVVFQGRFGNLDRTARYLAGLNLPFVVRRPEELRCALIELAQRLLAGAATQ